MKNGPFVSPLDSNLTVRNCTLYFRVSVPRKHRLRLGRTEFKCSLRTPYLREARQKAAILSGVAHKVFRMLEGETEALATLSDGEIRALADKWLAEARQLFEDSRLFRSRAISDEALEGEREVYSHLESDEREALAKGDLERAVSTVDEILKENGITNIKPDSREYRKLCLEIVKARIMHCREAQDFMRGIVPDSPAPVKETIYVPAPVAAVPTPPVPQERVLKKLSRGLEEYIGEKKQRGGITAKTELEYRNMLRDFIEVVGDVPANKLTVQDLKAYRDYILFKAPARRSQMPQYRDKSVKQLMKMNVPPEHRLSGTTISNRFDKVQWFVEWLKTDCQLPLEFGGIFKVTIEKRPDEMREVFTPEDLKTIFYNPLYREDKFRESCMFWIPLLALHTGARLEELGQLYLDDIKQDEASGVWYLDINTSTRDKSLKTKSARRCIPLHRDLLEIGFLKRVAYQRSRKAQRLFPELQKVGVVSKYTQRVSKAFSYMIRKLGLRDDGANKTFHSFRHTFENYFKQLDILNTPDEIKLHEVIGHAPEGSETRTRYTKPYTVDVTYRDIIARLDYGLDLSFLKESRFTQGPEE